MQSLTPIDASICTQYVTSRKWASGGFLTDFAALPIRVPTPHYNGQRKRSLAHPADWYAVCVDERRASRSLADIWACGSEHVVWRVFEWRRKRARSLKGVWNWLSVRLSAF